MTKDYKQIQRDVFKEEFRKFFKENISTGLEKIEKVRILAIVGCSFIGIIIAIIGILSFLIITNENADIDGEFFKFVATIILFLCFAITGIIKLYKNYAKKSILPKLLNYIGDFELIKDASVNAKDRIYVESLDLFDMFNRYNCDDRIKGVYKGIKIDIAEIELLYVSGYGRSKSVKKVFNGVFLKVPSLKKFKGKTIIESNFALGKGNKDRIHLEDPEFEKRYNTYGTDQIEARYLITPAFMNRMVELSKKGSCKNITLSFEYDYVNIAVASTKDWFEVPFTKPATEISNYRGIVLELLTIFSIVDSLKLDMNIGM